MHHLPKGKKVVGGKRHTVYGPPHRGTEPHGEELKEWHTRSGRELKRFFNTSGLLYKSMHLKEKLPEMPPEEQFERLATNGMLVKRPLLVGDDFVLIGFRPAEWEAWKEAHA